MRIRAAAAALVMSTAVVACSSDPAPSPLPVLPTSSPTPSALSVPPEALAETPHGAAAFTRYFFDLLNQAFDNADASAVRRISDSACGGCNNLIEAIEQEPIPGERVEGGDFQVVFAEAPPVEDGEVVVDLRYALAEGRVVAGDGRIREVTPANPGIDAQLRLGTGPVATGSTVDLRG
ncbi:MAG: DUF6318 family protein [Mycobacteriales bacterium]